MTHAQNGCVVHSTSKEIQNFPDDPVVKTQHIHCRQHEFDFQSGKFCMLQPPQKKKKKKKQGNSEDIKVICEGSDRFHFRQFVLVPVEHPQLRKEVCIRDMVLAMISCSIISMETCRTWAQKNTPFVSKLSYLINKLILDCC